MLSSLEAAKRRGGRIIDVNPLPEAGLIRFKNPQRARGLIGRGTELADLFLQVSLNGDLGLFQLLNQRLLERHERGERVLDEDFITSSCEGFEAFADHVRETDPSDRKSVVSGKSVSVRVDPGGRRIIKKKK